MTPSSTDHYARLAADYDRLWSPSDGFVGEVAAAILAALDLRPEDRFVDLGGGTGLHAREIARLVGFERPPLVVDPSPELLAQVDRSRLRTRQADAAGFAAAPDPFDKLLLKEMIHHLDADERVAVLGRLAAAVEPGGRLLVVLLPPRIDHPLFAAALERFAAAQPDHDELATALREAGLEAEVSFADHPLEVPRGTYLAMVRGRYMSLLSGFSDAELEAGAAEIEAAHPEPVLRFTYRLAFVSGTRGAA